MQEHYDYIITGTGCAGLSLAMHLIHSGKFADKRILLVDEAAKNKNDRTWCFWEKESNLFEPIVYKQWEQLWFFGEEFYKELSILPYRYKMIRGLDFYQYCFEQINGQKNFEFHSGKVESVFSGEKTGIVVDGRTVTADYVFKAVLPR
ncbi:MAG: hypothetical protein EON98_16385 [Chitinophagaceae bacterium]|nr:MAG: hypothetical protein EON98_16385 [Chitinophagaceae bacterium]